jgi:hypothetical protein
MLDKLDDFNGITGEGIDNDTITGVVLFLFFFFFGGIL